MEDFCSRYLIRGHPYALHAERVSAQEEGEGEKRSWERKEELFGGTVLPGERSQLRRLFVGISKPVLLEVIIPPRVEGVISTAITPTVILLYFAAHLFPSLLAKQGNILRAAPCKMRHNRTPRHCLFCLVWKRLSCKDSVSFKYLWIFHKGAIIGIEWK